MEIDRFNNLRDHLTTDTDSRVKHLQTSTATHIQSKSCSREAPTKAPCYATPGQATILQTLAVEYKSDKVKASMLTLAGYIQLCRSVWLIHDSDACL